MTRMSWKLAIEITLVLLALLWTGGWVQNQNTSTRASSSGYPGARFPSSAKLTVSANDVMPYARQLVQNKAGAYGAGLSVMKPGDTVAIVLPRDGSNGAADPIVVEAVRRALLEHQVKAVFLRENELTGVSEQDATALAKYNHFYTSEKGFMEVRDMWFPVFPDPKVPASWLKATRPDLYSQLFPAGHEVMPESLQAIRKKLGGVGKALQGYLQDHPEVTGLFWGGSWYQEREALGPFASKLLGSSSYSVDRWGVMSGIPSYPGDVWELTEEKNVESIAYVDRFRLTDPEGTDISCEVSEELARRWAKGVYERGHNMLFPNMATGRFARTIVSYPAVEREWIPRAPIALANGVVAGTTNHVGFFPRIEMHYKDGYLSEVVGGGTYGEVLRTFLKSYPNINNATYPYTDRPGYFRLIEVGLGTNPKWLRNPDLVMDGRLTFERVRSGYIHIGVGMNLEDDDPNAQPNSLTWKAFTSKYSVPIYHGFHVHIYFGTYRAHLRNTDKWVDVVDRGRMKSLDDPEVRALASRYGDPDKILAEDWIPEVAGLNAPGKYEDYARDPWKYQKAVLDKITAGTYEHYSSRGGAGL